MIVRASVEFLAPRFRAGLVTAIFTPADAEHLAELADQHEAVRGGSIR